MLCEVDIDGDARSTTAASVKMMMSKQARLLLVLGNRRATSTARTLGA